ncbi:MAG TPA: glycerate kinase [Candidatus Dormibacteraeota bacterium]
MRVVCAPNAFKGTLTAAAAAAAMAAGVRRTLPDAEILEIPVADGGDGTLDVLLVPAGRDARVDQVRVTGPLGDPVTARLGWVAPGVAVVELAEGSGLRLLGRAPTPGDALRATSRGAGEMVRRALDGHAQRVLVGVGGSASTDGGAGLLAALGVALLDAASKPLPDGGGSLTGLATVDPSGLHDRLRGTVVEVAIDTTTPLLGSSGAAAVYGPQKGADPPTVAILERGLARLASVAGPALGADASLAARPGSGAAGGAAWGLAALGAQLVGGAALVCDTVRLDAALAGATLVLTGEGRLDASTATGKAPLEVLRRARAAGVPCVAVAGRIGPGAPSGWSVTIALEELARPRGLDPERAAADLIEEAAAQALATLALRPR